MPVAPEANTQFGQFYVDLISSATSNKGMPNVKSIIDPAAQSLASDILSSSNYFLNLQQQRINEIGIDKIGLLLQLERFKPFEELLRKNSDSINIQMLGNSIPTIIVSDDLNKLLNKNDNGGTTAAMAVRLFNKDGTISYIFLKESGTKNPAYLAENIPHETHHLLYGQIITDDIVSTSYTDPVVKNNFFMYQDELLATSSSGNRLHGYTLINRMSTEQKREVQANNPKAFELVTEKSGELYDLARETNQLITETGASSTDYIYGIFKAQNFDDLKTHLQYMNKYIQQSVKTIAGNIGKASLALNIASTPISLMADRHEATKKIAELVKNNIISEVAASEYADIYAEVKGMHILTSGIDHTIGYKKFRAWADKNNLPSNLFLELDPTDVSREQKRLGIPHRREYEEFASIDTKILNTKLRLPVQEASASVFHHGLTTINNVGRQIG
jgi:hypothetical protein